MKTFIPILFILTVLGTALAEGLPLCPACRTANETQAQYCKHCGRFIGRAYPEANHLFSVSTADVLPSMDIQLAGGGAYGLESEQTLLGNIGIGLGDMAEISLTTHSIFSNLGNQSAVIPASGFKVRLFTAKGRRPAVALGFRISPASNLDERSGDLAAETAPDTAGRMLDAIVYTTRFTEANLSATLPYGPTRNTVSFRVMDVRFSQLSTTWTGPSSSVVVPNHVSADDPHYFYTLGAGSEFIANANTRILLEVAGMPLYDLKKAVTKNGKVEFSSIYSVTGGIRFYFSDWLYSNAGIKYQSDYNGLADLNLRTEINLFIPVRRLAGRKP